MKQLALSACEADINVSSNSYSAELSTVAAGIVSLKMKRLSDVVSQQFAIITVCPNMQLLSVNMKSLLKNNISIVFMSNIRLM